MSNRVMAAKGLKLKRQRRAWAKTLSRKGYMQPNREVIREYKDRAAGLAVFDDAPQVRFDAVMHRMSREAGQRKLEALKKQAQFEMGLPRDCEMSFKGPTVPDMYQETLIYFNSTKTKFVLILRDLEQRIERVSTVYSSKELLIMCWGMDKVAWVGKRPLV